MPASVYHQTKHKQWSGLQCAPRASKCFNCGGLCTQEEIFKGWCASCLASWGRSADRALIESARLNYTTQGRIVEPPTAKTYERLKSRIAERRPDEWFIPMTLYVGNYTIGRAQANWNYLQALYELEIMKTAQAVKLGRESHDLLHLCGRHAPMQQSSLGSFIGRVINSPEVWRDIEPRMREYIQDFISEQSGNFRAWVTPRRRIARYSAPGQKRSRRGYRVDPNYKTRAQKKAEQEAMEAKIGPSIIPEVPAFWPFAVRSAPDEHAMLHEIDSLTRGIPEQWRQDVCQDLVVAVLSGEVSLENLRDALPKHLRQVFLMHPIKYGDKSLDAPIFGDGARTLHDLIAASSPDNEDDTLTHDTETHTFATGGWHEGWDRPVGLTRMGDLLRHKHGGRAID